MRSFAPVHYNPHGNVPYGPETARVGFYLYTEGGWVNPYICLRTGPSAHVAPLFPLLLAALYHVFGNGPAGSYAFQLAEATVLTLEIAALPLVAEALGVDIMAGFVAAVLAVFGLGRDWHLEGNFVGLLLIVTTVLACKYLRTIENAKATREGKSPLIESPATLTVAMGVLWGAVLLTNPSAGLVWFSWLTLGGWYSYRRGFKRVWLLVLLIPAIMIAPWSWRNYRVFHGLVLVRSNLGLELSVSNNPCAAYSMLLMRTNGCFWINHPNTSLDEARKVRDLGEITYNKIRLQQAKQWIRANPGPFWKLTGQRFFYFWFPADNGRLSDAFRDPRSHSSTWIVYLLTPLSVFGLVTLWQTNRQGALICASFLALYPLIYYLVAFDYRYRYPIIWVTFLLGSIPMWNCLQKVMDRFGLRVARSGWLVASATTGSAGDR